MLRIERTEIYASWVGSLKDDRAKAKIAMRVDRLALGNPGDAEPVGGGVSELKIATVRAIASILDALGMISFCFFAAERKKAQSKDTRHAKLLFENWKKSK